MTSAGFWRRTAAFVIDMVLLGVFGSIFGYLAFDFVTQLGQYGRLVGLAIVLVYFGLLESQPTSNQTLGKRLLGIAVQTVDGGAISMRQAVGRISVIWLPFFFSDWPLRPDGLYSLASIGLSVATFGVGAAALYLLVFNRKNGQSLHDLLFRTRVVRIGTAPTAFAAPAKLHLRIVGGIVVLAAALPLLTSPFAHTPALIEALAVQRVVSGIPGVENAGCFVGATYASTAPKPVTQIDIYAKLRDRSALSASSAMKIAQAAFAADRDATGKDVLVVTLTYGFDIGIAHGAIKQTWAYRPAEWVAGAPLRKPT